MAPKPSILVDVIGLTEALKKFAADRNWEQFHSPKNLVMALTGEVGELSEIFQWMTEEASKTAGSEPETAQKIQEELADVLLYLVQLASILKVDLNEAVQQKMLLNGLRYPIFKTHSSSKKYDKI